MDNPTTTPDASRPRVVGPPTRRRLPVLKLAVVLLLGLTGGAWWLSRPRIGPQLVGTWWHERTNGHWDEIRFQPNGQVDGLVFDSSDGSTGEYAVTLNWKVEHDQLFVEFAPVRIVTLRQKLDDIAERIRGEKEYEQFTIMELTADVFQFHDPNNASAVTTFRRDRSKRH